MASPIAKERIDKLTMKITVVICTILYLYAVLAFLHFSNIIAESKRITVTDAMSRAAVEVFTNPLGMFPINPKMIVSIFLMTVFLGTIVVMYASSKALRKHDNPDTVNGSAHLMTLKELEDFNKRRTDPIGSKENDGPNNMIISRDIKLAIDGFNTRRNCNILAIGGSGAGKTRFFGGPNILQYNANFVITDPSGEMLEDYAKGLEDNGYIVKVFNISDPYRGNRYNPFHYIKTEKDVFIMTNTLIKNTNPSEEGKGDPFWEKSENLLISALSLYLWHVYPEEQQTFSNLLKLINMAEVNENDSTAKSPLDIMFENLKKEDPGNLAVKQYEKFKLGAGKTLKSILISVGVRLQSFDLPDIQYLTAVDEFEFETFADSKQAIFVVIPTADDTFNFIVSMLYSQLFSSLYDYVESKAKYGWKAEMDGLNILKTVQASSEKDSENAEKEIKRYIKEIKAGTFIRYNEKKAYYEIVTEKTSEIVAWRGREEDIKALQKRLAEVKAVKCRRRCPYHVRFILDEFANIGQIPSFDQKLATIRKYEISCSIILQAISQLKEIYDKKWNTIVGNCDTKLFLGSDDQETIEWLIKMLGKRTTVVENTSYNANGGGSTSYNHSSIELLTIDQIGMMKDDECIVRIRGERPYYGKKYELTLHPNYKYAHSVAGKFEIPVPENVKKIKEATSGPYRLRKKSGVAQEMAKNAEENPVQETQKESAKTNTSREPVHSETDEIKNEVKRAYAKEAKADIEKVDAVDHSTIEAIAETLSSAFGVSPGASSAQIKEAVESVLDLQEPSADAFVYLLTE